MSDHIVSVATELTDVTVVELGASISGAFAARILGDFGAAVVKVEPSQGDPLRDRQALGSLDGMMFEYLNWNKNSAVIDLHNASDGSRLSELLAAADVVVSSLTSDQARAYRLTPDDLRQDNPESVVVSLTDFGIDGPYSDWAASELVLQAMGGVMAISGTTSGGPLKRGLRQTLYYAGINAAYAALAGLYALRTSGQGVTIDVALRDCVCSELVMNQSLYAFLGVLQSRPPDLADPLGGFPLESADGYVTVQASTAAPMSRLAELFGNDALKAPEFASKEGRTARSGELRKLIAPTLIRSNSRDFFVDAAGRGFVVGFNQGADEMLNCEQLNGRSAFTTVPGVVGGRGVDVRFPAPFGRFSGAGATTPVRRAPALGEMHTLLRPADRANQPHRTAPKPLSELKVLDLSQVFAGPYMGALLADFGATVIKVESPFRLDQARTDYGGYFDNVPGADPWNRTSTFQVINRGKKAISLDLKSERGQEILLDLVADADILLENFTPRVMGKLGLSYDRLRERNPGLIMLSNSGFGATGPWSDFKAQGTTLEATMGICTYTGYEGGPPSKAGQSYPDFIATWTGLTALFAALVGRLRTGLGQWIDLGMYELGVAVMPEAVLNVQLSGREMQRSGNREFDALCSGTVRCMGEEDWLAFSAATDQQVASLRCVVGVESDCTTVDLIASVEAWARTRSACEAAEALQEAGVAAGKVLDARDLLFDPQLGHRRFYDVVDIPPMGQRPIIGRPFRWTGGGTTVGARHRAPRFGEHTGDVLATLPHFSKTALREDVNSGAVALIPVRPLPATAHDYSAMLANGVVRASGGDYLDVLRCASQQWSRFACATSGQAELADESPGVS